MNRRAMALLTQLTPTAQAIGGEWAVAAPLHQHGQDMLETMQARLGSNNWEQFQHNRVIGDAPHSILLNGFGLPDRRGLPHSRIVLLLAPYPALSLAGDPSALAELDSGVPSATHGCVSS
jgi:hypothetical protein